MGMEPWVWFPAPFLGLDFIPEVQYWGTLGPQASGEREEALRFRH